MLSSNHPVPLAHLLPGERAVSADALRSRFSISAELDLILLDDGGERILIAAEKVVIQPQHRLVTRPRVHAVTVSIDRRPFTFSSPQQTGRSLKERAGLPLNDVLFEVVAGHHDRVIGNDEHLHLREGQCFFSQPGADYGFGERDGAITVSIDRRSYRLGCATISGADLKRLAAIPDGDLLVWCRSNGEDIVVASNHIVDLTLDAQLYSQPSADYGTTIQLGRCRTDLIDQVPRGTLLVAQPDGWTAAIVPQVVLPTAYDPGRADLLIRLPPQFPDAAPDMFWVRPALRVNGSPPHGSSIEHQLGEPWMRFSWHLRPNAWQPGVSTFQDYLRCVRGRFERGN